VVACLVRSLILMWSVDLEPGSVRGESQKCKDVPTLTQTLHGSNAQFTAKTVGWSRPSFLVATPEAARLHNGC
jgi:hypothetical protein